MKKEQDYIWDMAEIRFLMERSSKFLSLSGWAGIMAGIYALSRACIAYDVLQFNPEKIVYSALQTETFDSRLPPAIFLAIIILFMAISTAIYLSYKKAKNRSEEVWNAPSKRHIAHMAVPIVAGGILILILFSKNLIELIAPFSLLFYGHALYNASKFTYVEVKFLGMIQVGLGLLSAYFINYGLLFWAIGFGVVHIDYGIYMHLRYKR